MDEADTVVTPVLTKAVSKWRTWATLGVELRCVCLGSGSMSYTVDGTQAGWKRDD
jgi:hypothetical protein